MLFLRKKLDTQGETVNKFTLHLTFSIVCVFSISANISCWTFVFPLVYSAGVTVKSIVKGSTVDQDGRIHIGDIILSVSARKKIQTDGFFYCTPIFRKNTLLSSIYSLLNLTHFNISKCA